MWRTAITISGDNGVNKGHSKIRKPVRVMGAKWCNNGETWRMGKSCQAVSVDSLISVSRTTGKQGSIPVGCIPSIRWPPVGVSSVWGEGVCPQVNKCEQVSSDDHQMSLARVCVCQGGCLLPCDLSHDACNVTYLPPQRQTDRHMRKHYNWTVNCILFFSLCLCA